MHKIGNTGGIATVANTSNEKAPDVATDRGRLLEALSGRRTEVTPVWFMRQAGRYLPEYRALREKHAILEIIGEPELAVEATLQPLRRFEVDAAIVFSDILPSLSAMGLQIDFVKGEGPVVKNPIKRTEDVDALAVPPSVEALAPTLEAIRIVSGELRGSGKALIGFAGAPFTLASYAIEGGSSRNFAKTKSFMYTEPAAWKRLMTKLTTFQADYLRSQAEAGAEVLQLFDSWAGLALGKEEYREYVAPYNLSLSGSLEDTGVPLVSFSTGTAPFIDLVAASCGTAISVDWHLPIDEYRQRLGDERPLQGNLDPAVLLSPWREVRHRAAQVMRRAAGIGSHVFNLGHGVLPGTEPDTVARLVDFVHEWRGELR